MKQVIQKTDDLSRFFILACYKCKSELQLEPIHSDERWVIRCGQCKIICQSTLTLKQAVESWNDLICSKLNDTDELEAEAKRLGFLSKQKEAEWVPITPNGKYLNDLTTNTEEDCWWRLREHLGNLYPDLLMIRKRGYRVVEIPF